MGKAIKPSANRKSRRFGVGRPRKDGPRKPNGRLRDKAPAPNPVVVAQRQVLLGNLSAKGLMLRSGENALDLMLARGWLGKDLHTAAEAFATMHRRSGLTVAQLRASNPEATARGHAGGTADAVALYQLTELWGRLTRHPAAKNALLEVCILGGWPRWVIDFIMCDVQRDDACPPDKPNPVNLDRLSLRIGLAQVHILLQEPAPDLSEGSDLSRMVDRMKGGMGRAAA